MIISGKLWKGAWEKRMEILFFVIVIGVVYWFFHQRIAESYTGKNVYSKYEIQAMKNAYLNAKGEYETAERTYKDRNHKVTYPIITSDFTAGDPRILSLPLPTDAATYPNRDGNDPFKICGSKFLNYETLVINSQTYKSTDKVNPVNIEGCYTYLQAKKTAMDNAWATYSPFAPRKKKRSRRRKFRLF